jgi:hypothetical protein
LSVIARPDHRHVYVRAPSRASDNADSDAKTAHFGFFEPENIGRDHPADPRETGSRLAEYGRKIWFCENFNPEFTELSAMFYNGVI